MHADGLVSTIIPVYNRPLLVRDAIDSVLAQNYRPIEIIVVDDGSTDGTADSVLALARIYPEIRLLRQSNTGPGGARQKGVESAIGEFIQFLDSDDLLRPTKFANQVEKLRSRPDCGACYGKTIRYELGGPKNDSPVKWTGRTFDSMFPSFLADRWWDTSTPLYRSGPIRENGPWLGLRQEEDWEFDCRLASKGMALAMVESIVSETRVLPTGRLSIDGSTDAALLRDRCIARGEILQHAIHADVAHDDPYMRQFLNGSFLLARQAALAGLNVESAKLIRRLNHYDHDLTRATFLLLGHVVGLRSFARFAEAARRAIRRLSGRRDAP